MKFLTSRSLVILLVILLSISSLSILTTKAESIIYPTEPNKQRPTLQVHTPIRDTFYANNTIEVAFSVTIPQSWNSYHLLETPGLFGNYTPLIGKYMCSVFLDRVNQNSLQKTFYQIYKPDVLTANYSITLEELERGSHSVIIEVYPTTYYENPEPDISHFSDFTYELETITETIPFRITSYLTPSPDTTPIPSPEPEFPTTQVLIIIITVIAGFGILAYSMKRKK
jgi:hypothetical protein